MEFKFTTILHLKLITFERKVKLKAVVYSLARRVIDFPSWKGSVFNKTVQFSKLLFKKLSTFTYVQVGNNCLIVFILCESLNFFFL